MLKETSRSSIKGKDEQKNDLRNGSIHDQEDDLQISTPVRKINSKGVIYAILANVIWAFGVCNLKYIYQVSFLSAPETIYFKSLFMNICNLFLATNYYLFFPSAKDKDGNPLSVDVFDIP